MDCKKIRTAPFNRLVKEVAGEHDKDIRFSSKARQLLQSAVEHDSIRGLYTAGKFALHANRVTVTPKDLRLAKQATASNALAYIA